MRTETRPPGPRLLHLLLALVVTALSTWMAAPAWAHATLVDSSPRPGDHLDQLPAAVSFEFSDTVLEPAYVVVTAPDGTAVESGEPTVEGKVVWQVLADGPDGGYTMAYRAVSEDGHPLSGEITFSVGDARTGDGTAAEPPNPAGDEPDPPTSTERAATGEKRGDATESDVPGLSVVVAAALFGGAAVLLVLSRRKPT